MTLSVAPSRRPSGVHGAAHTRCMAALYDAHLYAEIGRR